LPVRERTGRAASGQEDGMNRILLIDDRELGALIQKSVL
jgi:hypothetical protein